MKRQKKRNSRIIGFLIVTAGLLLLNYPLIAGMISSSLARKQITEYVEEEVTDSTLEAQQKQASAYNTALAFGKPLDAFSDFPLIRQNEKLGFLEIPKINCYAAICYGTESNVLKQNLGVLEGTSLPVGGESTHCVITGHTGMASSKLLSELTEMEPGDRFTLYVLGEKLIYAVDQIQVVKPEETKPLSIVPGEDHVTLLTCTPYGVNDHRLLVRGVRVVEMQEKGESEEETDVSASGVRVYSTVEKLRMAMAIVSTAGYLGMVLVLVIKKVGRKQ